jgi:predicted DNA binding protein
MATPQLEEGTMYAAAIEVRHDCPVGSLSRNLPNLRIAHWCVDSRDLFQVSGPDEQIEAFREDIVAKFGGRQVYATESGVLLVTQVCRCGPPGGRGIGTTIRSAGVWDIPPIIYREGWESWRVLAWSEGALREMFRAIREVGEVRIVSLRPIENLSMEKMMLMPAGDVFGGLTEKQSLAVLLGLRHGYYSMPSQTSIDRLADGAGLSSSTFSEHLRKAESRILQNLRPYLEAFSMRAPGDVAVEEIRSAGQSGGRSLSGTVATGS